MRLILFLSFIFIPWLLFGQQSFKQSFQLMGCNFDITLVAENEEQAEKYIQLAKDEMERIERLISSWDSQSQTSAINRNAGIQAVQVDPELFQLLERALVISKLTDGAFDISYASMDKIWKFDGSMKTMPDEESIRQSVAKVGFEKILLDSKNYTVFLSQVGMKIGFGGIGKGYAADKAKELLLSKGVTSGIVNASGDMNAWGMQSNETPWKVAITNPLDKTKAYALLPIKNQAVVTSGSYEKHVTFNDTRYAHIIDPRSGYPSTGILSVTVFAPKAELADALATSVFVMGIETGLDRINQLPEVECIIIDDMGHVHKSSNIEISTP